MRSWEASDEARDHARMHGVTLKPGETFVLPHTRGTSSDYFYYSGHELRSHHGLAQFERVFWD